MEGSVQESTVVAGDTVVPPSLSLDGPSAAGAVTPQASGSCPSCAAAQAAPAAAQSQNIYVIGRIEPRFPQLSVEKELQQATGRAGNAVANLTDRQATARILTDPANKYLARQLCWVLLVQGVEAYILVPRDPADYLLLTEAYRDSPDPGDLDTVVGIRGPMATPTMCNGLIVPILIFDQIYSFDRATLLNAIPKPQGADQDAFVAQAGAMFDQVMQQSDNVGATDQHRALNYLALRYDQIYATAAAASASNQSLTSINVLPSPLTSGGTRRIVEVVFTYTNRVSDVPSRYFVRVDVTEEWPFLVSKMAAYYSR
jgi:PatG C-terminal